jgi:septal ring factor EnvC (AmiA/AmiB activator)
VHDAGSTIDDVVRSVGQVNELIREIAVASNEQSGGVEEMNKALIRLEAVTEHNASLVQQVNTSAMQLKGESTELAQLVGRFRVDGQSAAPARAAAREPAPALRALAAAPNPRALAGKPRGEWRQS